MRPALLIAIVAAALGVVIGVDVWGARSAQHSADAIFEDATRSIVLVEDMRWQLHKLVHIGGGCDTTSYTTERVMPQ